VSEPKRPSSNATPSESAEQAAREIEDAVRASVPGGWGWVLKLAVGLVGGFAALLFLTSLSGSEFLGLLTLLACGVPIGLILWRSNK
jgi:predicted lipid-binding transport protein (Tim44 family)